MRQLSSQAVIMTHVVLPMSTLPLAMGFVRHKEERDDLRGDEETERLYIVAL